MAELNASQARATLPELLNRAADGEEITITRHGRPVAVLLRPDALTHRRGAEAIERARELGALLAAAREQPLVPAQLAADRADKLVRAVQADRDRA